MVFPKGEKNKLMKPDWRSRVLSIGYGALRLADSVIMLLRII